MVVTTTMDDTMETQWICRDCFVAFNKSEFQIDLICLTFKKIDVVLGMD